MSEHLNVMTPAAELLGRRLISVDKATGEVCLGFTAPPEFANRHGTVHGGLLAAMLDSAAANAVLSATPPGMAALTMRLDTRFHRPAPLGELNTRSRVIARDERGATVEAAVYDPQGNKLASAEVSFRVRPRERPSAA